MYFIFYLIIGGGRLHVVTIHCDNTYIQCDVVKKYC